MLLYLSLVSFQKDLDFTFLCCISVGDGRARRVPMCFSLLLYDQGHELQCIIWRLIKSTEGLSFAFSRSLSLFQDRTDTTGHRSCIFSLIIYRISINHILPQQTRQNNEQIVIVRSIFSFQVTSIKDPSVGITCK